MPVHNAEVAGIFRQVADMLDIQGKNEFRVRAYRRAARMVKNLSRPVADLVEEGFDLASIDGIGDDLAEKIRTIVDTGTLPLLDELKDEMPARLHELLNVEGLGPKRVAKLHEKLGIDDTDDLKKAARDGKIRDIDGFGKKTEQKILDEVMNKGASARTLRADVEEVVAPLVDWLKGSGAAGDMEVAGSFRRRKETVGDIDIVATAADGRAVTDRLTEYEDVERVVSRGDTRSTVVLRTGLQVDLRVVKKKSFGAALHYFTGSKAHNIAVRKMGQDMGYKVNEYGVFDGEEPVAGETEESVYDVVGLPWIPPELRENRGELDAAKSGNLPNLVELSDIRGDLHSHTDATDGVDDIHAMADAAKDMGHEYLAITNHTKRLAMTKGHDPASLAEEMKVINRMNGQFKGFTVLSGAEVDIFEDGSLDLPDDVLDTLDIVLASVHHKFGLSRKKQTERIITAMKNPRVNIICHPTGRLLNEREPYDVDMERIVKAAAEYGVILELNAQIDRLDLTDIHARMAKDAGAKIAVSTDAHAASQLQDMRHGIGQARRGWLEAGDIVNTRSLDELRKLLKRRGD